MSNQLRARQWHTAKSLHQIQLLSCDYAEFEQWISRDLTAPFWRLYWHDRAGAFLLVGGKTLRLPATRFTLIPPHTPFGCGNTSVFGQLFFHFRVDPNLVEGAGQVLFPKASAPLNRLARSLIKALKSNREALSISLRAQALLAQILETVPEAAWKTRYEDPRVTDAISAIRKNYPRRLDNASLAKKAALHPGAFIRLFRETTGHTPGGFLMNLRMEEASMLLHSSELSIDEVAAKTGFCDRGHFSRVFRQRMGLAPAAYRKLVDSDNRLRK